MSIEDRGREDPPALHHLEAELMDVWQRGECSVRQVMMAVNADAARPRAYTTYMTVMTSLGAFMVLRAPTPPVRWPATPLGRGPSPEPWHGRNGTR